MKTFEEVDPEVLRKVVKKLFDGVWGDDVIVTQPIPLTTTEPDITNTEDRARLALKYIHRARGRRVIENQLKYLNLDLLLLGVTDEELRHLRAAIEMSVRDYLRPLADLVGLWDEDEPETTLAVAVPPSEEKKDDA